MAEIRQNDKVRWSGEAEMGPMGVGRVVIAYGEHGDSFVNFPDHGICIVPTAELSVVRDDEVST